MRKFIAAAVMAASLWGPSLHAATSATPLITHDLQGTPTGKAPLIMHQARRNRSTGMKPRCLCL